MRSLMCLSGLVPIPSDALVTPVTFKVRKRKLRGILQDWDALEDGKRELTGEWVVGRRLWRKLQSEWQRNNAGKEKPPDNHKNTERIVLYVHGGSFQRPENDFNLLTDWLGAYFMFDAITHRLISIPLSKNVNARVFCKPSIIVRVLRFLNLIPFSGKLSVGSGNEVPWSVTRRGVLLSPSGGRPADSTIEYHRHW